MIVWRSSTSTLDALFLGVVQVVVYTGAVMMLFLFVLMLDRRRLRAVAGGDASAASGSPPSWPGSASALLLIAGESAARATAGFGTGTPGRQRWRQCARAGGY